MEAGDLVRSARLQRETYHHYDLITCSYCKSDVRVSCVKSILDESKKGGRIVEKILKQVLQNKKQVHECWEKCFRPGMLLSEKLSAGDLYGASLLNQRVFVLTLRQSFHFRLR